MSDSIVRTRPVAFVDAHDLNVVGHLNPHENSRVPRGRGHWLLFADVAPRSRDAALLAIGGRDGLVGVNRALFAGVGVDVALRAVVVGLGAVGRTANMPLNVSSVFFHVWFYVCLGCSPNGQGKCSYEKSSSFHGLMTVVAAIFMVIVAAV